MFWLLKVLVISGMAEQLLASEEGFGYMRLAGPRRLDFAVLKWPRSATSTNLVFRENSFSLQGSTMIIFRI
jgi:hypothetical protein